MAGRSKARGWLQETLPGRNPAGALLSTPYRREVNQRGHQCFSAGCREPEGCQATAAAVQEQPATIELAALGLLCGLIALAWVGIAIWLLLAALAGQSAGIEALGFWVSVPLLGWIVAALSHD